MIQIEEVANTLFKSVKRTAAFNRTDIRTARSIGRFGLSTAIRSVAAFCPSDATVTSKDGPKRTLAITEILLNRFPKADIILFHFSLPNMGQTCSYGAMDNEKLLKRTLAAGQPDAEPEV